jgi:hypothetical protein
MLLRYRDTTRRLTPVAIIAAAVTVTWLAIGQSADARRQAADVTVRGCVERDAAASTPIYKLVTPPPALKIYRLTAPKEIDVAAHVGHTVDITGTVSAEPPGRSSSREAELTVKKLTMVRDACSTEATPRK